MKKWIEPIEVTYQEMNCPCCVSSQSEKLGEDHLDIFTGIGFVPFHNTYTLCQDCGLIYWSPAMIEEDMRRYYQSYFRTGAAIKKVGAYAAIQEPRAEIIQEKIKEHFGDKKIRVMEVGCSSGQLLEILKMKYGHDVWGVEPNEACAKSARERLGEENVFSGFLDQAPKNWKQSFDILISYQVLEHTYDPKVFLTHCMSLLEDKGVGLFEVPNLENHPLDHYDALAHEHTLFFTPKSFEALLKSSGCEVLGVRPEDAGQPNSMLAQVRRGQHPKPVIRDKELAGSSKKHFFDYFDRKMAKRQEMMTVVIEKVKESKAEKVIVYGVANDFDKLVSSGLLDQVKLDGLWDDSSHKQGRSYGSVGEIYSVERYLETEDSKPKTAVILTLGHFLKKGSAELLKKLVLKNEVLDRWVLIDSYQGVYVDKESALCEQTTSHNQ